MALRFESCDLKSLQTGGDSNRCKPQTTIQDISMVATFDLPIDQKLFPALDQFVVYILAKLVIFSQF